tara:strand:- start:71 stop:457 length:387 start_codon:yes stop_codon:yes gene_type:complete
MIMIIKTALMCLALNVYHEARDQSTAGQVAVAQVVINRVNDERFPDSVCKVVKQPGQFSWLWDKKSDKPYEEKAWDKSLVVARTVYAGKTVDITDGATYYHANYVNPSWARKRTKTVRIDDHIFYKWD